MAFSDLVVVMAAGHIVASRTAPELIARPPTRQVAELLGIRNILAGDIISRDGKQAYVAVCPRGPTIRIATNEMFNHIAGDLVTVTLPIGAAHVFRPEQPTPAGWDRLPGVVRGIQWLATSGRLEIETPTSLTALAPWEPAATPWVVGERAVAALAPEAAYLVPEER